jgi:hypothetical protein
MPWSPGFFCEATDDAASARQKQLGRLVRLPPPSHTPSHAITPWITRPSHARTHAAHTLVCLPADRRQRTTRSPRAAATCRSTPCSCRTPRAVSVLWLHVWKTLSPSVPVCANRRHVLRQSHRLVVPLVRRQQPQHRAHVSQARRQLLRDEGRRQVLLGRKSRRQSLPSGRRQRERLHRLRAMFMFTASGSSGSLRSLQSLRSLCCPKVPCRLGPPTPAQRPLIPTSITGTPYAVSPSCMMACLECYRSTTVCRNT